jgi:hypothetical protein
MFKRWIACSLMILIAAGLLLAHGNATHIMGTITALEGDHVTVKLQDGKSETVMFNKATKYLSGTKAATRADLKIGTRVVIDAKMDAKMKMFLASEVRIGVTTPAAPAGKAGPGDPTRQPAERK